MNEFKIVLEKFSFREHIYVEHGGNPLEIGTFSLQYMNRCHPKPLLNEKESFIFRGIYTTRIRNLILYTCTFIKSILKLVHI